MISFMTCLMTCFCKILSHTNSCYMLIINKQTNEKTNERTDKQTKQTNTINKQLTDISISIFIKL